MTEDRLHRSIFRYLKAVLPSTWEVLHIPNNPRSAVAGARLKAMGMLKGAPDILILGQYDDTKSPWVGFAEVKTLKGHVTSEQRKVHERLRDLGIPVAILRSLEDARDFIAEHNLPSREVRS